MSPNPPNKAGAPPPRGAPVTAEPLPAQQPMLMGILNLTPDSFSDGGRFFGADQARRRAQRLVQSGAHIVDVGAESSRPGAKAISAAEEMGRLQRFMARWQRRPLAARLSIDTRHATTARWALQQGAQIINDISGSPSEEMIAALLASEATYVLMHNAASFEQMHHRRSYDDVAEAVEEELRRQLEGLMRRGLPLERIWLDPGLGFAKGSEDNWQLITQTKRFAAIGPHVLVGPSRKRFVAQLTGATATQPSGLAALDRATAAVCSYLVSQGALILRVHNPTACREALRVGARLGRSEGRHASPC